MDKSLLPLELCELGVLGWSLIELGQAELAAGVMRGPNPNPNPKPNLPLPLTLTLTKA